MQLPVVMFEVTNKCNLTCEYCYVLSRKNRHFMLSLQEIKLILKTLKENFNCKLVVFTGGEPFLRKDLEEIVKYTLSIGLLCSLATNGSLIKEDHLKFLKNSFQEIKITYDGSSTCSAILNSLKLLRKNKIPFTLHTTISNNNIKEIDQIIIDSLNFGAKRLDFNVVCRNTRIEEYEKNNNTILLNRIQLEEAYDKIFKASRTYKCFISHHLFGRKELNEKEKLKKFLLPYWNIRADGFLFPMVDINDKWIIADFLNTNSIDFSVLENFKKVLVNTYNKCGQLLISTENVVNYGEILCSELNN